MFRAYQTILFPIIYLWGSTLLADVVELKNGSKMVGEILSYSKNKLKIATDFAGEVEIDALKIKKIISSEPLVIEVEDGTIIHTRLTQNSEYQVSYSEKSGSFSLNDSPIRKIITRNYLDNSLKAEPTLIKEISPWLFKLGLNFTSREGPVDTFSFANSFEAIYSKDGNQFKMYQNGGYSDGQDREKEFYTIFGIDTEYRLNDYFSAYFRDVTRKDQDKDLHFTNTMAVGFGHYFIRRKRDKEEFSFRLRSGLGHTYKQYDSIDNVSEVSFDASLYVFYKKEKYIFSSELIWEPTIENLRDYRIYHETKLEVPLGLLKNMSLQIGMTHEYLSITEDDENLETIFYTRLLFSW